MERDNVMHLASLPEIYVYYDTKSLYFLATCIGKDLLQCGS